MARLLILLAAILLVAAPVEASNKKPNVLFILTDDLAIEGGADQIWQRMRQHCDALRDAYDGPYSPERFPTPPTKKK